MVPFSVSSSEVCAQAAKVFADQLGCKLEEASPWKDDYFGQFFTIVLAETDLKGMREFVAKYGDHMQPHLVDAIKGTMTDVQITDALMARKKCANQAWRFFRTYDLLLTPTIACTPFKQGIQGPETIEGKKAVS
jgi:aspartyl-tRNA(Asn)/glutamyl-tRNA(Gln) amidotransferase subunit A